MSPKNIFITGCGSGVGLELVKQYLNLENPPKNIFASCRDTSRAQELVELSKANKNVHLFNFDVTNHDAFPKIVEEVSKVVGDDGLNLLINNAATPSSRDNNTAEEMRKVYEVNTISPFILTQSFLPLIKKASAKANDQPMSVDRAAIVMITSSFASISENESGGFTAYRCSKVALNMVVKNLSLELKQEGILTIPMHPGWVKTKMGGPNALITTETCCSNMVKTLSQLGEEDDAKFIRYNNTSLNW